MTQRSVLKAAKAKLAKGADRALSMTTLNPPRMLRRRSPTESLPHAARMRGLASIAGFYNRPEYITHPEEFFGRREPIEPTVKRARKLGNEGEVLDLSWPSQFEPLWQLSRVRDYFEAMSESQRQELGLAGDDPVRRFVTDIGIDKRSDLREKYLNARRNQTAHARWFRHRTGPRPCVVLLHGYMTGSFPIEERMWPVKALFASGMDVVITVLPFHGLRRSEARGLLPPMFPSNDPRFTVEGFRQLVLDHRALFDYLLEGRVSGLGVMGMSLGGYGASLLATLEERLRFGVFFIPLSAIEEFAHMHGRLVGDAEDQNAQREGLRAAHWPVSPLARPAQITGDNVVVIAGESDIVTGLTHAQNLVHHFDTPLVLFEGGHLLHFGRERAFVPVWDMLRRQGHIEGGPRAKP